MRISDWSSDVCSSDLGVGDIVVTARRRSESLQNTPVAVTAITGAALEQKGATNISAVAQTVLSLTFNTTAGNSGASNAAVVFIPGIGQAVFFPTLDPGVGIYRRDERRGGRACVSTGRQRWSPSHQKNTDKSLHDVYVTMLQIRESQKPHV